MTELQANEEALRVAAEIFGEERERGRRKNRIIVFLLVLNFLSFLLHLNCDLQKMKGYENGQGDCDARVTDTVSPTA